MNSENNTGILNIEFNDQIAIKYEFIRKYIYLNCCHYPKKYSPTGEWDSDAVLELAHKFIADNLLGRNLIKYINDMSDTEKDYDNILRYLIKQFAAALSNKDEYRIVYSKIKNALIKDKRFVCFESSQSLKKAKWCLAKDEFILDSSRVKEMNTLISDISDIQAVKRINYTGASLRDPIISETELAALIEQIFLKVNCPLDIPQILGLVSKKLYISVYNVESLDAPIKGNNDENNFTLNDLCHYYDNNINDIFFKDEAVKLFFALDDKEKTVFKMKYSETMTYNEIGNKLNISKSQVELVYKRVIKKIPADYNEFSEVEQILKYLSKIILENSSG